MKPQQRVVTAQDVESSLYYFHVDSAGDQEIREALQASEEAKRLSGTREDDRRHSSEGLGLKRKPLPVSPQLALGDRPEVLPKVYPHFQTPDYRPREPSKFARKPVPSPTREPPSMAEATPPLPPRKPLGPRPLHSGNISTDTTTTVEGVVDHPAQNDGSDEDRVPDFSITIIRRDPTSGGQWNVGKLTAGAAATRRKSSFSPSGLQSPQVENSVSIEIFTEGYNRFIDHSTLAPTPGPNAGTHPPSAPGTPRTEKFPSSRPKRPAFRRQLLLEKPRSQSTNQSPRRNGLRPSVDSRSSEWSTTSDPSVFSSPLTPPLLRPYTFQSPWNGTCEFSTGVAGRSLKCRHSLPSPANSAGQWSHSTYTVSELRFNLPNSKIFTKGPVSPKRPPLPTSASKRSSFLSSEAHSRSQSVDGRMSESRGREQEHEELEDGFDDWMDLSLGREQAGGGIRGKQAKLGKLIVEDEGLKMLDLVVAANMGVWWGLRGWEGGVG